MVLLLSDFDFGRLVLVRGPLVIFVEFLFVSRGRGGTSEDLEGAHLLEFVDMFFAGLLTSQGGEGNIQISRAGALFGSFVFPRECG